MPHITCFQHIDCEGPGSLSDILAAKGVTMAVLKPFQGDAVPERLGDGLIVLGGPMGVYEERQFPWMTKELDAIRHGLDSALPVLGICLGSQMLAKAAGGQIFRGAQPEVGWYPLELTAEGRLDPLLLGLPDSPEVFHWHGDTFTLPEGSVRLAQSALYRQQVFRVGHNAYGFQCHLEVTEAMAREWVSLYAKELTPQGGPNRPERILEGLPGKATVLKAFAETVFSRFAALL